MNNIKTLFFIIYGRFGFPVAKTWTLNQFKRTDHIVRMVDAMWQIADCRWLSTARS